MPNFIPFYNQLKKLYQHVAPKGWVEEQGKLAALAQHGGDELKQELESVLGQIADKAMNDTLAYQRLEQMLISLGKVNASIANEVARIQQIQNDAEKKRQFLALLTNAELVAFFAQQLEFLLKNRASKDELIESVMKAAKKSYWDSIDTAMHQLDTQPETMLYKQIAEFIWNLTYILGVEAGFITKPVSSGKDNHSEKEQFRYIYR